MRAPNRSEQGFTLIEALVATTLMVVGIAVTLGVFGASGRTTVAAQRTDAASEQAQGALDQLGTMAYGKLGLTSTPTTSTNPLNPNSRVSGTTLTITPSLSESFVLSSDSGQSAAAVDPTPTTFAVGTANGTVTGKIYRYVTWRDENCPAGICDGTHNTKRITVAVTIDAAGTFTARAPVWVSQIIPDPSALPPGTSTPPSSGGGGSGVTAQDFYLYDMRCGNTARTPPSGAHVTHNTAASGSSASFYSTCENTSSYNGIANGLQPDLMGTTTPTGNSSTPLYVYSTDLAGTYDGGLAMKRQGTTCPTNYAFSDTTNVNAPNEWSLHAWATNTFSSTYTISGPATLSLFTQTFGGVSGRGLVCATLLDRTLSSGVPQDTTIGSTTYDNAGWPATVKRISFSFNVSSYDIASGHRLVLVLGVRSESASDLVFVYDHPLYPSFLEVATPTPLP